MYIVSANSYVLLELIEKLGSRIKGFLPKFKTKYIHFLIFQGFQSGDGLPSKLCEEKRTTNQPYSQDRLFLEQLEEEPRQ